MTTPVSHSTGDGVLRCTLSADQTPTMDAVYDRMSADLGLPDHFGRNLDALYDCLTGDVDRPFQIDIVGPGTMRDSLGEAWHELAALLLDVVTERDDATVTFLNG